ncbi:MAG: hypothetical protein JWM41_2823 [Gemmatimonadetes bacterium]|nr:hypothetical protein [Gemmatimonadota bacterium]
MDVVRRFSLLATASLLGIAVMLGWASARPVMSSNAASSLSSASSYFDSTIVLARGSRPRGSRGDELVIALGYLERLRLGLGSPFRLVDEAAHDPRLRGDMSPRVAWAVLARLRRGDAYAIDASVLDGAGPWAHDGRGTTGAAHLALIEHAVRGGSDPRAGELAVRLAYQIEAAKGALASSSVSIATQVAALVRDRELAVADVADLFADAGGRHADVLELLAARRAEHTFRVERPPLAPIGADLQLEAMNAVPGLVRALDTLDRVDAPPLTAAVDKSSPVIGRAFAARLVVLSQSRPPVAQVVVTLRSHERTALRATNDESLAAGYSPAAVRSDSARRPTALALLSAAVALRSLAQQVPWFAGDGGPDAADLAAEFGLANVSFARGVPSEWRPYYMRELQGALRDMQRVLPTFAMDGLRVQFGVDALPDSALAMHDPRTRTLQLSVSTSGGTLAHELSHDLDWQASRRLFAVAGGYSTDRSIRERRGTLARSLRGLAEARLLRSPGVAATAPMDRPAELFARGADWFVASSLAQQGRTNGFLSAIEDASLGGYAAGPPTAIGVAGAGALTSAIEAMTYLPDSTRAAFESQWSDPRVVDPTLLVRRALETPVSWRAAWQLRGGAAGAAGSLAGAPAQLCVSDDSPASRARERLLMTAVDARARGMALRRARYRPAAWTRPEWASSVLGLAPWAPDEGLRLIDGLRAAIVSELTSALPDQGVVPAVPVIFRSNAASCSSISR